MSHGIGLHSAADESTSKTLYTSHDTKQSQQI